MSSKRLLVPGENIRFLDMRVNGIYFLYGDDTRYLCAGYIITGNYLQFVETTPPESVDGSLLPLSVYLFIVFHPVGIVEIQYVAH